MNQTLFIEYHGFTTPPQFHFCNKNSEKALVVQSTFGDDDILEVIVPNILLTEPYTITAYVYLTEDESSKTVEYVQIPVRQRPQPDSFEYEDNAVVIDISDLANEMKALNMSMSVAEEARVASELNRISNETDRQSAETSRISEETERINAENIRKENENTRVDNENTRTSSEQSRVNAETDRISSETIRKENETARQTAETERLTAEEDRLEAETNRTTAETERIEAENERLDAESARITAENERINAEVIRQSQEEARQTASAIAVQNANTATDRANLAAEACEEIVAGTGFISVTEKGLAGGVATLDQTGKVPLEQLPDVSVEVDTALSAESTNPIANKAVAEEFGKYLPKSGGDISGATQIFNHLYVRKSDASSIQLNLINSNRSLYHEIDANGNYVFYDRTNGDRIMHSTADGTNTFNGTATNATQLDGHEADYFAKSTDLSNYVSKTGESNIVGKLRVNGNSVVDSVSIQELALMKHSGGTVTGNITIQKTDASEARYMVQNSLRTASLLANGSGEVGLYDTAHGFIFKSTADGTNTFNGTASGITSNKLSKALTVEDEKGTILELVATGGNNVYTRYVGMSGALGFLGFVGADNPVLVGSDGATVRKLHHDGNSAKVVVATTTPVEGATATESEGTIVFSK